jgi:hypothetical protein
MAATTTRSKPSANGGGPTETAVEKAKQAGATATTAARRASGPALVAAAGLAGGLALGARAGSKRRGRLASIVAPRPRLLGIPVGQKPGALRIAEALRDGAKHLGAATNRVSNTADDVRELRDQLERANRRSPVEVLLDGLTHRRGAHRNEA